MIPDHCLAMIFALKKGKKEVRHNSSFADSTARRLKIFYFYGGTKEAGMENAMIKVIRSISLEFVSEAHRRNGAASKGITTLYAKMLQDEDPQRRVAGLKGLARVVGMGGKEALKPLKEGLRCSQKKLRKAFRRKRPFRHKLRQKFLEAA